MSDCRVTLVCQTCDTRVNDVWLLRKLRVTDVTLTRVVDPKSVRLLCVYCSYVRVRPFFAVLHRRSVLCAKKRVTLPLVVFDNADRRLEVPQSYPGKRSSLKFFVVHCSCHEAPRSCPRSQPNCVNCSTTASLDVMNRRSPEEIQLFFVVFDEKARRFLSSKPIDDLPLNPIPPTFNQGHGRVSRSCTYPTPHVTSYWLSESCSNLPIEKKNPGRLTKCQGVELSLIRRFVSPR